MLVGMGIVFMFLMLLVFTMLGVSRLARALEPETPADHTSFPQPVASATQQSGLRGDVVAVISLAISRYRAKHH